MDDTTVSESNAESWAYVEYQTATGAEKARILKARSIMMEHTDWVLDGYEAYYVAPDGTRERIPSFSAVFPEWDITQVWAYRREEKALLAQSKTLQNEVLGRNNGKNSNVAAPRIQDDRPNETLELKDSDTFTYNVPVEVVGQNAATIASKSMGAGVRKYVIIPAYMTGIDKCNIGLSFRHASTGDIYDMGFKQNIPAMGKLQLYSISGYTESDKVLYRASTSCAQPGWVTFWYYNYLVTK